jgi:hypothetical protein
MLGRLLPALLMLAAAAEALPQSAPKRFYQLNQRCQEVARLLAQGNSRTLYDLFVPQFRADIPFARFDSSLKAWYRGGQLKRIKAQLIDVRGLGGHASTWAYFRNEPTYRYVYQNWLYTNSGWRLVWLSNILNQTMQFGNRDSQATLAVAQAALEHITAPAHLADVAPGLSLPDTVFVSWPAAGVLFRSAQRPVRTVTPEGEATLPPNVPFFFRFGLIRVMDDIATCAVDLRPSGPKRRSARSLQLYFDRKGSSWQMNSSGKRW